LNIAPGLGKTKLILAAAINLVQSTQFPVFVLNSSKTLCDRDFQEATFSLEELKIPCASVISQKRKITFATTQDFIDSKADLPEKYHILLDEYQNIFFVEDKFFDFVEILKFGQSFIGFSGSPLNSTQRKLLEYSFGKQALVL
jgi:superfamily II DNA or RNA helicase